MWYTFIQLAVLEACLQQHCYKLLYTTVLQRLHYQMKFFNFSIFLWYIPMSYVYSIIGFNIVIKYITTPCLPHSIIFPIMNMDLYLILDSMPWQFWTKQASHKITIEMNINYKYIFLLIFIIFQKQKTQLLLTLKIRSETHKIQ